MVTELSFARRHFRCLRATRATWNSKRVYTTCTYCSYIASLPPHTFTGHSFGRVPHNHTPGLSVSLDSGTQRWRPCSLLECRTNSQATPSDKLHKQLLNPDSTPSTRMYASRHVQAPTDSFEATPTMVAPHSASLAPTLLCLRVIHDRPQGTTLTLDMRQSCSESVVKGQKTLEQG